jgi:hypothetical protein
MASLTQSVIARSQQGDAAISNPVGHFVFTALELVELH